VSIIFVLILKTLLRALYSVYNTYFQTQNVEEIVITEILINKFCFLISYIEHKVHSPG